VAEKNGEWTCLEDNDPTGYKSKKGVEAKAQSKIKVFSIPKRSPDLNVMDYKVWSRVNKEMRKREKKWGAKKETREAYLARLRRTAMSIPAASIDKWLGDMVRRCKELVAAKGGYING